MSGGIAVQGGSQGGESPRLHKRSAETWGHPGWSRRESLTAWGPQAPKLRTKLFGLRGANSAVPALGICRGRSRAADYCPPYRAEAEPGGARPAGERPDFPKDLSGIPVPAWSEKSAERFSISNRDARSLVR
jgi:hypothetical protein